MNRPLYFMFCPDRGFLTPAGTFTTDLAVAGLWYGRHALDLVRLNPGPAALLVAEAPVRVRPPCAFLPLYGTKH